MYVLIVYNFNEASVPEIANIYGPLDTEEQANALWLDLHDGDTFEVFELSSPNVVKD
jgi:hypothetical protein